MKKSFVNFLYIPFLIIAFIIPTIMFPITTIYNKEMRDFLLTSGLHTDYHHLVKVIMLYLSTFLLLIALFFDNKRQFPLMFAILFPVYICLFMSTYLSDYKISSLFGIFDHYEGFFAQTCYLLILICSYVTCRNVDFIYKIIKFVLWAGFIVTFFGVFEYAGIWPLVTEESYTITSTIGNSNYVGTFSAMIIPLSISVLLFETKLTSKVTCLLFFGSSIFLLLGSMSRAGFAAFIIIVPLFVILLKNDIRKNYIWILAAAVLSIALFTVMNICSENLLLKEIECMNPFSADTNQELFFEDITISGNSAKIDTNQWELNVEMTKDGYTFSNELGEPITLEFDKKSGVINIGSPYKILAYIQEKEDVKWILLKIDQKDIEFAYTRDELKVVGFNGRLTDINDIEYVKLPFSESFASGRGYIWSRTIPLLKETILIGYGPDTFPYIFPQNDIVGKLNYGAIWAVIGKPHNWYLQIAFGSGIISLILLLIFFIWYGINVIKGYRVWDRNTRILSCGIFLSIVGYLVTGVFNDSVVSVSPLFWMLWGFGIGINKFSSPSPGINKTKSRV